MKNAKEIESVVYKALITSIVGSFCIVIILTIVLALSTRFDPAITTTISAPIRLVILLLIVTMVLQGGVLFYKINSMRKICPKCKTPLPRWRIPNDAYETIIGGLTCPSCGTKLTWRLRERGSR